MKKFFAVIVLVLFGLVANSQPPVVNVNLTGGLSDHSLRQKIEWNTAELLTTINGAYLGNNSYLMIDRKILTPEALLKIREIWNEVKFYCASGRLNEILNRTLHGYQLRNIPVSLAREARYLVINYNIDGRIDDVYFGLELHQYNNVMTSNSVIDLTRREIILNFVENFRTAYIRKDIDFIEKVFSDHALIITGRVVQQYEENNQGLQQSFTRQQVEYQTFTKKEYIDRLRAVFRNTGYLMLEFNNIEVNVHRRYPNFYGVLLEQYWESSLHSDTGYLFLLIQFRDDDHPLIWVRTWQDAREVSRDEVFGFHNFRIAEGTVR